MNIRTYNLLLKFIIAPIACIWSLILFKTTILRISFPWDIYMWIESVFMTNMLKLHHGLPLYTAPADSNSTIYAPGLTYLSYAILKPLGLELDIVYGRIIVVLIGLGAVLVAAKIMLVLARILKENINSLFIYLVCCGISFLVIFQNITADVPHPDNLLIFHALAVFLLTWIAMHKNSFKIAILAMIFAGLGCFTKQTGALVFLGPLFLFIIYRIFRWPRLLILTGLGLFVVGLSLCFMWWPDYAFFYTYTLPSNNVIQYERIFKLGGVVFWGSIPLLGLLAFIYLWHAGGDKRKFLICWLMIGSVVLIPNAISYLKYWSQWNNLVIVKIWVLLITWPCLLALSEIFAEFCNKYHVNIKQKSVIYNILGLFFMLSILLPLYPKKISPGSEHHAYANNIQRFLSRDIANGLNVLLDYGASYLIKANYKGVPIDRADSYLELYNANKNDMAEFSARVNEKLYDKWYLTIDYYPDHFFNELQRNYKLKGIVDPPPFFHFWSGYQLKPSCVILEPLKEK